LFHPLAIERLIAFTVSIKSLYGRFFLQRWHCYDAHSDLSNPDPIALINDLNTIHQHGNKLSEASHYNVWDGLWFIEIMKRRNC
jgi:hypothetical protein